MYHPILLMFVLTLCACVSELAIANSICPLPSPGLKAGKANVNGENLSFSYRSNQYPVDQYSGFAPQPHSINYCLRYEVENTGTHNVEKLFWPLAKFEMDVLVPKKKQTAIFTRKSDNPPSIEPTQVFAFAAEQIDTRAYQVRDQVGKQAAKAPFGSNASAQLSSNGAYTGEKMVLGDAADLPEIGMEFGDEDATVTSFAKANWDGKDFLLTLAVSRNSEKYVGPVYAPFTYALYKGVDAKAFADSKQLAAIAREFEKTALPLDKDQFQSTMRYRYVGGERSVYLIEQPVTFSVKGVGSVCFLAPVYSPYPIAGELSCNLLR